MSSLGSATRLFSAGSVERILPRFARPRRVKTSNRGAMMYARQEPVACTPSIWALIVMKWGSA